MEPTARIFPLLQPIRVLTFNISTFYRICQRKQVTAISERLRRRSDGSSLLAAPSPSFLPLSVCIRPPLFSLAAWCQVGSALLWWSRSDHRLLNSVWEQICHYSATRWSDWNHTERNSSVMQLPDLQLYLSYHCRPGVHTLPHLSKYRY